MDKGYYWVDVGSGPEVAEFSGDGWFVCGGEVELAPTAAKVLSAKLESPTGEEDAMWSKWSERQPKSGDKFIAASDDGCSTFSGIALDGSGSGDVIFCDAECGEEMSSRSMEGSIWHRLPDDYQIHFMNVEETESR